MKIRMKTLAVGPIGTFHPGKVYTVKDVVGEPFVSGGYAERLDVPQPVITKLTTSDYDTGAKPRRGRGKR